MAKTKTIPQLTKKAQEVFNRFIRERDKNLGCISCGGSVDHAGHYFSAGQHSALRFHEDNVHGQCVGCNNFKHGNLAHYRINLTNRIGEHRVKRLEVEMINARVKKWSRTELLEIIEKYEQDKSSKYK